MWTDKRKDVLDFLLELLSKVIKSSDLGQDFVETFAYTPALSFMQLFSFLRESPFMLPDLGSGNLD